MQGLEANFSIEGLRLQTAAELFATFCPLVDFTGSEAAFYRVRSLREQISETYGVPTAHVSCDETVLRSREYIALLARQAQLMREFGVPIIDLPNDLALLTHPEYPLVLGVQKNLSDEFGVPVRLMSTNLDKITSPAYTPDLMKLKKYIVYLKKHSIHIPHGATKSDLARLTIRTFARVHGYPNVPETLSEEELDRYLQAMKQEAQRIMNMDSASA